MYATKLYQHKDFFLTIILAGGVFLIRLYGQNGSVTSPKLYFIGIKPGVLKVLEGLGVVKYIGPEQRYDLRLDALRHADQGGKNSPTDGYSGVTRA